MRTVIHDSVTLAETAEELFRSYLDPSCHAAITGSPVEIAAEPGSAFLAFEGMLSGTILHVVRPQLVVQSWRSGKFLPDDPDSTLILSFTPQSSEGRIDLVHLDVPEHDYDDVVVGWQKFYWAPWRKYLAGG